ncbi:hypothetical protein N431DRAFT_512362 [Stipitochalara longipes BDJ]|nr:hypothetical protein N431DRAFT_512362 [Stipitochalara longipes BDJ]
MFRPRAVELLDRPQMSNANVLVDIYSALQRLESSLDDQHDRIRTIEGSIHSTGSSPIHDRFSSIADSMAVEKGSPELPRHGIPPSSPHVGYAASEYEASVMKLSKRRFEFMDDSCSDLQYDKSTAEMKENDEEMSGPIPPPQLHAENLHKPRLPAPWNRNGKHAANMDNSDAYSQSVYSSRPLSRLELEIPPVPPLPREFDQASGRYSLYDAPTIPVETPKVRRSISVRTHVKAFSASLSSIPYRKSWSSGRSKTISSLSSAESSGTRSHERAEMAFYAYDNLKSSVRSSVSLRSKERRARRAETRRLKSLSSAERGGVGLGTMPVEKNELEGNGGFDMLYSFFIRNFGKFRTKYYSGRVSIIT